ncbi:MAG: PadR family transcriptional regulator [Candidatus Nanopelagicales bacterium]
MSEFEDLHRQELRRGTAVLACLLLLRTPEYGYQLLESLTAAGLDVDGNTLYPLLRRLEKQGLLASAWNTDEPRPRKYYETTALGDQMAASLVAEWQQLNASLSDLRKGQSS